MEEKREIVYSDISSMLRRGSFDALIYTDGTTTIAIDSDGTELSRGNTGTDDATVLAAAITACPAGGTIAIGKGEYAINTQIQIRKSLSIIGYGATITTTLVDELFDCQGDHVVTTPLTSDASEGDLTLALTSATKIEPGRLILVYDDTIWMGGIEYPTLKQGELHKVQSITDLTLTLDQALIHDYSTTQNAYIRVIIPISVYFEGLTLIGPGRTTSSADNAAIWLKYVADSSIRNCTLRDFGTEAISMYDSINVDICGCTISGNERPGLGYGVSVANTAANIRIHDNHIEDCRHCITVGGNYTIGQPRNLLISNNIIYGGSAAAIDAHPACHSISIVGNSVMRKRAKYGIWVGAKYIHVAANVVFGGIAIRGEIHIATVSVIGNRIYGGGGGSSSEAGILRASGTLTNIDSAVVSGNVCEGTSYGVLLDVASVGQLTVTGNKIVALTWASPAVGTANNDPRIVNAIVVGNHIYGGGRGGVRNVGPDAIIANNVFHNCGQFPSNPLSHGCLVINESGVKIIGNKFLIDDDYSTTRPRHIIWCYGDNITITDNVIPRASGTYASIKAPGNNNRIVGNTLPSKDGAYTPLLLGGTGNIIRDNYGYVTETSGAAASTADGGTIAHGCAAAPTKVTLTGSVAGEIVTVTSIDATNITVAIKKPDNSAGTTQTVYWRAEV